MSGLLIGIFTGSFFVDIHKSIETLNILFLLKNLSCCNVFVFLHSEFEYCKSFNEFVVSVKCDFTRFARLQDFCTHLLKL